jgi:DNA-binding transcriptional LysR family regulator
MELRHLRYFLEVAHDLNMTRAAQRLHMSQPPLSRQIQQLEEELGTKLFERVGKHLNLTAHGKFFVNKAKQILVSVGDAEEAMKRIGNSDHAWLNIGFVPSTIYGFLPELLRRYRATHPKIDVSLNEYMTLHQVPALKSGSIDVGFGRLLFSDPDIIQEILWEEPLMAVLPSGHALLKRKTIDLKSLAQEPLILYPVRPRPNYADQVTEHFFKAGLQPNIIQEVQELQTALGLVASGAGITIVPHSVKKMRTGDVFYRPFTDNQLTSPVVMMYRKGEKSKVLRNFIRRVHLLAELSNKKNL